MGNFEKVSGKINWGLIGTMRTLGIIAFLFIVCFPMVARADVPEYSIKRTTEKIVIDGILDETEPPHPRSPSAEAAQWYLPMSYPQRDMR